MNKGKIRCIIIGLGKVALTQHIPAMVSNGNFELAACVTRSKERFAQTKKIFPHASWYKTFNALIRNESNPGLAILCTPSDLHYRQAQVLLKHGYDLLIEKPVTLRAVEAVRIRQLAVKLRRRVFAFQNRHYDGDFTRVKDIVSSGRIGRLLQIELHMFSSFGPGWGNYGMSDWRITGRSGGMVYDWGSHLFEQVIHLFPEGISKVYARLEKCGNFKLVDDHDFVHIISKNNSQAFVFMSNVCPVPFNHWLIIGEKASLMSDCGNPWIWDEFTLFTAEKKKTLKPKRSKYSNDELFYRDLYHELKGRKGSLKVSFDDAIRTMKIIDAAFRSCKTGKPVRCSI